MVTKLLDTDTIINLALNEDCPDEDITSTLCIDASDLSNAYVIAKENGIFSGEALCLALAKKFEGSLTLSLLIAEGYSFNKNDKKIISISGNTKTILKVERVLLNFIQHLSGIATY